LPRPPLVSVTHFKSFDEDNTATTFATSNYHVDTSSEPGRLALKRGKTFPSASDLRTVNAYEITYVAGYGSSRDDVPTPIKQAIKLLVAQGYTILDLEGNILNKHTINLKQDTYHKARPRYDYKRVIEKKLEDETV